MVGSKNHAKKKKINVGEWNSTAIKSAFKIERDSPHNNENAVIYSLSCHSKPI